MFFYEGLSCPYCHKPFEDSDDIVACPSCGAPHHRECWKEHGACAHADTHGTEEQWTRDKASAESAPEEAPRLRPCGNCGTDNSPYAEICSHCGHTLDAEPWGSRSESAEPPFRTEPPFGEYSPFHSSAVPHSAVAPDTVIQDETAADLAAVVQSNTAYYLPKFQAISKKNAKLSWNWAAFLVPSYWLLFRKQYLLGSLLLLAEITLSTLTMSMLYSYATTLGSFNSSAELVARLLQSAQVDPHLQSVVHFIGAVGVILLLIRLVVALLANHWYLRHSIRLIRRSREQYPEGYQAQLAAVGGTSLILAFIGYMCMQTLPMLILMLIGV